MEAPPDPGPASLSPSRKRKKNGEFPHLLLLVKIGLMTEQELEKIRDSHAKFLASLEPYILLLSLMVCGEKPY